MTVINGVFEGGGAKGLMYVGALKACEDAGLTFGAVAGASAGAITAALVACGYTTAEIRVMLPEATKLLGSPARALAAVRRRSLLSTDALREWLARTISARVATNSQPHIGPTMAELRNAHGISLYVVAMDLATGQPLVFSPDLTPDAPVADAVVASSSIPVALPFQRMEINGEIRRLVDGGVWSNYPSFVFLDPDFRLSHDLADGAATRDTVGFILDDRPSPQVIGPTSTFVVRRGPPHSTDLGSAQRQFGALGGIMTSPVTPFMIALLPLLMLVVGMSWLRRELDAGLPMIELIPDAFEDFALLLLVLLFGILMVASVLIAAIALRLGRAMSDEALVGVTAALGVGPNVPYWVGAPALRTRAGPRHIAVRLEVPQKLTTLTSEISTELQIEALSTAYWKTWDVLTEPLQLNRPLTADVPPPEPPKPASAWSPHALVSAMVTLVLVVFALRLAFDTVRAAHEDRVGWWQQGLLLVIGLVLLALHGLSRTRRATHLSRSMDRVPASAFLVSAVVCGILAVGLSLSFTANDPFDMNIRERLASDKVDAQILAVRPQAVAGGDNTFVVEVLVDQPGFRADGGDSSPSLFRDLEGDDIQPCPEAAQCLLMETDSVFEQGDQVVVRYAREFDTVFLERDLWDASGFGALVPLLLLSCVGLGLRSRGVYRHRLSAAKRLSPPAPPLPLPANPPGVTAAAESTVRTF